MNLERWINIKNFENEVINKLLLDKNVTDISFNGTDIYYQDNENGRVKLEENIDTSSIFNYIKQLANETNEEFNDEFPILDSEEPNLRINAVHQSISPFNVTLSLRSSKPELKIKHYDESIAPKEVFKLLNTCVRARSNILISGKTGSGKTELQKYLVGSIRQKDKIILIEDTMDSHIKELYPDKDIFSWKKNDKLAKPISFDDLIKAGLRNNPDWMIISESRGSEAYSMLKSALSGHHIITTLHSNNASSNVERLIHMCKEKYDLDQKLLGSMICENFEIGIHVDYEITKKGVKRFISEIVEYDRYTNNGVIVNKLYSRELKLEKIEDEYKYYVAYNYGKLSKKIFDKIKNEKLINKDIEIFIDRGLYDE